MFAQFNYLSYAFGHNCIFFVFFSEVLFMFELECNFTCKVRMNKLLASVAIILFSNKVGLARKKLI